MSLTARDIEWVLGGWPLSSVWQVSRSSGTALVLTLSNEEAPRYYREEPDTRDWRERRARDANRDEVESQVRENNRRDFATLEVCLAVGYAYVNSRDSERRAFVARLGLPDYIAHLITEQPLATFQDLYDYLTSDMDAHPAIAHAAAERVINGEYRSRRESFARQVERLWKGDL